MNPLQLKKITDILLKNTLFFISTNVGKEILTVDDIAKLLEFGIDISKLPQTLTPLEKSYLFGQLSAVIEHKTVAKMTFKEFEKYLSSGQYLPLTSVQKGAIQSLQTYNYNSIKGLGWKQVGKITQGIQEWDDQVKLIRQGQIKTEAAKAIAENRSIASLASNLRVITEDWNRDWSRVADHLMHSAYSNGIADMLINYDGEDAKVWLDVYPGACVVCIKAYLTAGIGSRPKVFKISTLKGNGTNIGRKAAEWIPVIPPMHPWCRCQLHRFEEGSEWDDEEGKFKRPKRKPRPGRPLVKVKIGGRTFEG